MKQRIDIRFDPEMLERLRRHAEGCNMSVANLVRQIVGCWYEERGRKAETQRLNDAVQTETSTEVPLT